MKWNIISMVLQNAAYQRWTILPIMAFGLSWMLGTLGIMLLFPLLLTSIQYSVLRRIPTVIRPEYWFITSLLTCYVWLKWGPPLQSPGPEGVMNGVMTHYAGQLLNSLFILLIVRHDSFNTMLRWFVGTLVAAVVWLTLYNSLYKVFPDYSGFERTADGLAILVVYPSISLIANAISGLFLMDYAKRQVDVS